MPLSENGILQVDEDGSSDEDVFTTANTFLSKQSEQDALLDELLTRVTASPAPRPSMTEDIPDTIQHAVDAAVWTSATFGIWRVKTRVRPASLFQCPIDISTAKPTTSFS